jgi:membrane-associated phospholipid phosphatase
MRSTKPMSERRHLARSIAALSLSIGVAAQAETIVTQWNAQALQAIRITHPGPPIVARALAVANTCMYDAWAAYDSKAKGTQFGKSLRRPSAEHTDANKTVAISYAAYRSLVDLFPSQKTSLDAFLIAQGLDPNNGSTDTSTPAGIGNVACKAVLDFRHTDGSNQLGDLHAGAYSDYSNYQPVNTPTQINDPNRWQPVQIGANTQKFITPFWGQVTPFALKSLHQYKVKPPPRFGSDAFLAQAEEVLSYSASLTDTQKVIAEYWADGPDSELPPGHWGLFATFVSNRDNHSIDEDTKMFFAMNNALLDASVWTWGIKRKYDYVRPVTAIHYLFAGRTVRAWAGPNLGTQLIAGDAWKPYQAATIVTPPFAEYVSGHSTFSAAAATVLKLYTGSDVFGHSVTISAGSSRVEPGLVPQSNVTLSWATFTDAADEAGISRRHGGIHFIDADVEGRRVGKRIGAASLKKSGELFGQSFKDANDSDD